MTQQNDTRRYDLTAAATEAWGATREPELAQSLTLAEITETAVAMDSEAQVEERGGRVYIGGVLWATESK